jgi:hypothetical protein
LLRDVGGTQGCSARLPGEAVDVMLVINKDQKLILIAGRQDWKFSGSPVEFTLQIDGGEALAMKGDDAINLVMTTPSDDAATRIKKANLLRWHLPWGDFDAHVTGIDKAFGALQLCDAGTH